MTGPELEHPLVDDYLRDVDSQLEQLRTERASELREQISKRLAMLPAGSDDAAVAAALARLGTPSELVAATMARRRRTLRSWLTELGWQRRVALGAAVVLLIGAVAYVAVVQTTAPLAFNGVSGWW